MSVLKSKLAAALFFVLAIFFVAPVFAEKDPSQNVAANLDEIDKRLDDLQQGQKALLLKLDEILQELNKVKIRVRRT